MLRTDVYKFKTRPYRHQVDALKKLKKNGWGGALLMEPRTGKTKVAIDYASILHIRGRVNRVLIFCPAGVMGVWEEEIPKHCPVKHRITLWDKDARKETDLPRFGQDILDFVIVNYEAASTAGSLRRDPKTGKVCYWRQYRKGARYKPQPDQFLRDEHSRELILDDEGEPQIDFQARKIRDRKGGRYEFRKRIAAWQPQLICLDESHRIKNPSAAKSRSIKQFKNMADYRVIMTGTVVTKAKRIYDIYGQWQFLNPFRFKDEVGEPMTYAEFKEKFSVIRRVGEMGYPKWIRNKNEAKLHKLIHKDAFSVLRRDCFDLPPLTQQIVRVHLNDSADVYDQMAEDMVASIESGEVVEASIALVLGLRLRQISNGLAKTSPTKQYPKGRLHIIGSEKLQVIEDRLEDLMEAGEHVIIGASFRPDIQRLEKLCNKRRWKNWVVMGGVSRKDRDRYRREYEATEGGAIFIGNPAAASEGIDLRSAAIMIWYSLPQSWVHYTQYMDRNALHPGPRFVEYLIASPADEVVYETLMNDEDLGKKMITNPKRLLRHD